MCALGNKKKKEKERKSKQGEGNDAKSPHSASDRRRQHPDSLEVGGWRGGGTGMEEEWGVKKMKERVRDCDGGGR